MDRASLTRAAPFLFVCLWSSAFVAIRAGLPDVSPLLFLTARFALAAVALIAIVSIVAQPWRELRGRWHHLIFSGVLMNAFYLSAAYSAMQQINAATMALIGALHPLATAFLAHPLLGERMRAIQWLGLALGVLGVALAVGADAAAPTEAMSALLAGAGVICLALGTVHFRKHCRDTGLVMANTVQMIAACAACTVLTGLFEEVTVSWTPTLLLTLPYLAWVVSLGAMALLMLMLRTGEAGRVASNFYLTPGVTAILGWLVLGESLGPTALAGFAVACLGVWLAQRRGPA